MADQKEQVPTYDAERQGSLRGVAEGLASEDDAAVLGTYGYVCFVGAIA